MKKNARAVATRKADEHDAAALTALINRAFEVESSFAIGDRIAIEGVRRLITSPSGFFFVATERDEVHACVWAEQRSPVLGYIGLLAVEPSRQGRRLGRTLMDVAEQHLVNGGCQALEVTVVDLRTELFPFYERRGYRACGTLTFPRPSTRPCHLVRMMKTLPVGASS